jgi:hypothetical protein
VIYTKRFAEAQLLHIRPNAESSRNE